MPKPYSIDLRERVVGYVDAGHSRHAAAAHFRVSVSFVVILMRNYRKTESLAPRPVAVAAIPSSTRIVRSCLVVWPRRTTSPCRSLPPSWLLLQASKSLPPRSHVGSSGTATASKKTLLASEQDRPDISRARQEWRAKRQPRMRLEPHRLVFIDETGTTTKMTRLRGRCLKGQRLRSKAPFGHWKTQTFIAGLRCYGLTAPFVIDTPMNRRIFETYVETQLAPTLAKGDVVILDNLAAHKSPAAEAAIKARGAWMLFLPPYSPDLNPIEMAFAKLKAHLRAKAVTTIDALWQAIGNICNLFSQTECRNYFTAAGYGLT